jgi:DNA ligase-1
MLKLPKLYKKTSTGATQYWEVEVRGSKIKVNYGQVGGKEQTTEETIDEGKNLGKANETTPVKQAELEATSLWEKKKKRGYTESVDDAKSGKVDKIIEGGVFPMLAHEFSKQGHKIKYPCWVQPKLDGHRCTSNKEGTLWSRTRKLITGVPHINQEIRYQKLDANLLDGELYNHDYHDNFETLSHFIRQENPIEGHKVVQYHIYDIVMEGPFSRRLDWLVMNIPEKNSILKLVETKLVLNEEELIDTFEEFLSQGYEGAIVRNTDGLYEHKRSYNLQKIKEFMDSEYLIIGVEEGRGKMAGKAIFVCQTEDKTLFKVRMKGNMDALRKFLTNSQLWEGRQLTVQYQGLTGKNNVPRFPVGLRIRDPE